jgi:hypothetical protein
MRIRAMIGERQSREELFVAYVWRDPERCSPERLAELAAHDDYIKALERLWSKPYVAEIIRKAAA